MKTNNIKQANNIKQITRATIDLQQQLIDLGYIPDYVIRDLMDKTGLDDKTMRFCRDEVLRIMLEKLEENRYPECLSRHNN